MSTARPWRLVVFLPDPLKAYVAKGEVKPRYYNPGNVFDEVHFVSFCDEDVADGHGQYMVGQAQFAIHTVGALKLPRLSLVHRKAGELVKRVRPQVIRAYDPLVRGWLAVRWAKRLGIPAVVSVHNNFDDVRRVYWANGEFIKAAKIGLLSLCFAPSALRGATRVVGAYEYAASYARQWKRTNVEVIYNRIDTDRFRPPSARPVEDRPRPRVLCVGRLVAAKGQETLLRAIGGLDVDLLLVGSGPDGERLRTLAHTLGVGEQVTFLPAVPHDTIHELYAQANIFAIPIRWGGVCIPVLEAMAAGLPVVVPQPAEEPEPEVVGKTGVVVENTPEGFRQGLIRLIAEPALRATLGAQGRAKLEAMDGAMMESREEALYRTLIEEWETGAPRASPDEQGTRGGER